MSKGENFRSRRFFITFWHEVNGIYNDKTLSYCCQCYDKCTEEHDGKFHGHAFIYFKTPQRFSKVVKFYGEDCHNESMIDKKGRKRQNSKMINYIMDPNHKHGKSKYNRIEFGEMPCDNGIHYTAADARNMTIDEVETLNIHEAAIVLNIKEKLRKEDTIDSKIKAWHTKKNLREPIEIIYHTGESGTGKTWEIDNIHEQTDKDNLNGISLVYCNGEFWDYDELNNRKALTEPHVLIINEFRDSTMKLQTFLQMLEGRGCIPIKGGSVPCAFLKKVVICSIIKPWKLYKNVCIMDENTATEIKRRITKIIEHKKIDGEYFQKTIKWPEFN